MKQASKTLVYLLFMPTLLWLGFTMFAYLTAFSYSGRVLAWVPYIILGGWVPGKLYGLTLMHLLLCIAITFGLIGFFDRKIQLANKVRTAILILVSLLFTYEGIFNFFYQSGQDGDQLQFKQMSLLQFSFLVGILIKIFSPKAEMNN